MIYVKVTMIFPDFFVDLCYWVKLACTLENGSKSARPDNLLLFSKMPEIFSHLKIANRSEKQRTSDILIT